MEGKRKGGSKRVKDRARERRRVGERDKGKMRQMCGKRKWVRE